MLPLSLLWPVAEAACENRHSTCEVWATSNQCATNEPFMRRNCAEACGWCLLAHEEEVYDQHLGRARAVLETSLGELHLGFYETLAPATAAHIIKLIRLGG